MIEAFKKTLSFYGVTGKQLSERTGIAQATISEIRRGKSDPSLSTFWRLIGACEEIAPGSLKYFCGLLASSCSEQCIYSDSSEKVVAALCGGSLEAAVISMTDAQVSDLLMLLSRRFGSSSAPQSSNLVGVS